MAEKQTKRTEKKKKPIRIPIISAVLSLVMNALFISFFAGFVCLLLESGLYLLDTDKGYMPAAQRMQDSVDNLTGKTGWIDAREWVIKADQLGKEYFNKITTAVQEKSTDISDKSGVFLPKPQKDRDFVGKLLNYWGKVLENLNDLLIIWYVVTIAYAAKMLSLFAMVPCYLLIMSIGAADSFAQHGIDTFKGKRTSQDKMEYWHYAFYSVYYLVPFLYLAIPNSVSAYIFMLPYALLSSFLARQVLRQYKKYI